MKKKSKFYLLGILALFCMMPNVLFAQNLTVEGTVKDEIGEPLVGVTVHVQGVGTGAITDLDGHFTIPSVRSNTRVLLCGLSNNDSQGRGQDC